MSKNSNDVLSDAIAYAMNIHAHPQVQDIIVNAYMTGYTEATNDCTKDIKELKIKLFG